MKLTLSIKWKIILPTILILCLGIATLSWRLLAVSFDNYYKTAHAYAAGIAFRHGTEIQEVLETYETHTKRIADDLLFLMNTFPRDRELVNRYLINVFNNLPVNDSVDGWISCWVMFEPNAFDGTDAQFRGENGDSRGVFTPQVKNDNKTVLVYPEFAQDSLQDYYQIPKKTGRLTIINPYIENDVQMISIVVPLMENNRFIGVFGTDIRVDFLSKLLEKVVIFETGYLYLISADGNMVYDQTTENIGINVLKEWETLYPQDVEAIRATLADGKERVVQAHSLDDQKTLISFYEAIPIGFYNPRTWVITSAVPRDELLAAFVESLIEAVIISVLLTTVIIILLYLIIKKYAITPLFEISQFTLLLAGGDYSHSVPEKRKEQTDEIGGIAHTYQKMCDNTREILSAIKTTSANLTISGQQLCETVRETKEQIQSITGHLELVHEQDKTQNTSIFETAETVSVILHKINHFDMLISEQVSTVTQSASAIEQIIASIQSVDSLLLKINQQYSDLINASRDGSAKQQQVEHSISKIVQQSQTLTTTNSIIVEISEQTNLLAMNAAIEAAHAGESGKGFAVVSQEIRKLSENSAVQSKQINEQIKEIKISVDEIVGVNNQSKKTFQSIVHMIETINGLVSQVSTAISEQSGAGREVLEGLEKISEVNATVKDAANDMSEKSETIAGKIATLKNVSAIVTASIAKINDGITKIDSATEDVSDITGQTTELITQIDGRIDKFKLE